MVVKTLELRAFRAGPRPEVDIYLESSKGTYVRSLAEDLGAEGPRATLGMVCVSSAMALIHATRLIRPGAADRAFAGGHRSDGARPPRPTGPEGAA